MEIKILRELNYTFETTGFLREIYNGSSQKKRMKTLEQEYGSKNKAAIRKMFDQSFIAETAIKKNINFAPPEYEENGNDLAEFMFKSRGDYHLLFVDTYLMYEFAARNNVSCKKLAILLTTDDTFYDKHGSNLPMDLSESEFFKILHSCGVSDSDKLDAMQLYFNFDMYKGYMDNLVAQATTIMQNALPNLQAELDAHMDVIQQKFDAMGLEFLTNLLGAQLEPGIYLAYPSLFTGVSVLASYCEPLYMHFGLHLFDLLALRLSVSASSEQAEVFLKIIADNTKLGILKLLQQKPMYGIQLADALNCTNANISHHMHVLLDNALITVKKENNRMYYSLNKEAINERLDSLKTLFV